MLYANPVAAEFISGDFYGQSSYHLSPDKLQSDFAPSRFERELKIFRSFSKAGTVLDVGCSTGAFLHRLKSLYGPAYEVVGTDVPGPALDHAASHGIPIIAAPFPDHDFRDQRFDAITFWAVLEHLDQPGKFLAKAASILRSCGHCFILVPNARSVAMRLLGPRYRYVMPEHLNYFTGKTLLRFVQNEPRFRVCEVRTTHFNPVVIWQDWRSGGLAVSEQDRAHLLKQTTALKESTLATPLKFLYRALEHLLSATGVGDNLVLILQRC